MKTCCKILALLMLSMPFGGHSQTQTLRLTDARPGIYWPAVEYFLGEQGSKVADFKLADKTLRSEFVVLKCDGNEVRIRFSFRAQDTLLHVMLTDYQVKTGSSYGTPAGAMPAAWADSLLSAASMAIGDILLNTKKLQTALDQSNLFPRFQSTVSKNGLSVTVESAARIGNWFVISGFMKSDTECSTYIPSVIAQLYDGKNAWFRAADFDGKPDNVAVGSYHDYQAGTKKHFHFYFSVNEEVNGIYALTIRWGKAPKGTRNFDNNSFGFHSVPVPMNEDPELKPYTIEVYRNVYLNMENSSRSRDTLRLHFTLKNNSMAAYKPDLDHFLKMKDNKGKEYTQISLNIRCKSMEGNRPVVAPGEVCSGSFCIIAPVDADAIDMFTFSSDLIRFETRRLTFRNP